MGETARTVGELAELVRSKNAGPFWVTLDVFLSTDEDYRTLVESEGITPERVGQLYRVEPSTVEVFFLPHIRVVKVSFPRSVPAGSFQDRDQHAGQQHVPLSQMALPGASVASSGSKVAGDLAGARSGSRDLSNGADHRGPGRTEDGA